jgi:hypothetical protein
LIVANNFMKSKNIFRRNGVGWRTGRYANHKTEASGKYFYEKDDN